MQAQIQVGPLLSDEDWTDLAELMGADESLLVQQLLGDYRAAGAKAYLLERAYIDRDFSAAYSAFYSTLFHPYLKYCQRFHFFGCDLSHLATIGNAEGLSREVESHAGEYLGYVVLRPVSHAPVAAAVISAAAIASDPSTILDVTADYPVHVVGADLTVTGFPLTQQDTRVGACAQAAIWMAGRHFHRAHGGPWFSMPDINDAALKPTDNFVTRSLPAGSEFLRPDNIIRALRAMDRHPVFDLGKAAVEQGVGIKPLQEVIGRYLDSGIPVLIGLKGRDGATVGHAVVAIGRVMRERGEDDLPDDPTSAELISHLIVADDQRGPVCRLPVYKDDALPEGTPGAYPWTLEEDAVYSVTPLPGKVFMSGEIAETLSRDFLASCVDRLDEYRELAKMRAGEGSAALGKAIAVDPSFFAVPPSRLVARTYLTYGWRYKGRALRNRLPEIFKLEIFRHQYPRYVWVTEFSLPDDLRGFDQCQRKVRAHVVVDATGSKFGESMLIVQVPGLSMFWTFDADSPTQTYNLIFRATDEAEPFLPKVRNWSDFDQCEVPDNGSGAEAQPAEQAAPPG
jgi:hypothetical protein